MTKEMIPMPPHCDGLDGPVVKAARQALVTGNVKLVLIWVQASDEAELRKAFAKTIAVRKLNSEAKELADLYFFETLVRIPVSYTHLRAHETRHDLVCRLLLEK